MKTEIRNVTSLTVDEINECCPVCRSKLFGDRPPSDLSTAAIKNWLLSLKELESSNQELRFVLWEYGEGCGPLAGVSIRRSETDAEKASLAWLGDQPAADSRNLLSYFRLLPEGRFMLGIRGTQISPPRISLNAFMTSDTP